MKSAASVPNPMPSEATAEARVAFKRLASLLAFWCEDLALDVVVEAGTDPSEGLEAWRRLIADYDTRMAAQLSGTLVAAQGAEAAQGSGGGEFDGGAGLVPTDVRSSEGKRRNGRRYAKDPWIETRFCYNCGSTGHLYTGCRSSGGGNDRSNDTCKSCGEKGHWATECPRKMCALEHAERHDEWAGDDQNGDEVHQLLNQNWRHMSS